MNKTKEPVSNTKKRKRNMFEWIWSYLTHEAALGLYLGMLVGAVFGLVRLQPPAPATLAGIMGIIGLFIGGKIVSVIMNRFFS